MALPATRSPRGRASAFARAGALALAVLGLDQLTKHLIRADIALGDERKFFIGIRHVHVRNTGVAFSLFSGGGGLVLAITLAALALLLGYLAVQGWVIFLGPAITLTEDGQFALPTAPR